MRGNGLCHVRCYMGYTSMDMHPTLTGYDFVRLMDNTSNDSQEEID
jgi:hypothetical protein